MIYTVENTILIGKICLIRRNGKLVKNCLYADTDKGIVKTYGRNSKLNNTRDGVVTYVNKGRVEVEFV